MSDEWATPQWLFNELNEIFHFSLDLCATADNAKCRNYFTQTDDGLKQKWQGICWLNPPYSQITPWIDKAYQSSSNGATVVCLLPSRTDTLWWHSYAVKGDIFFVNGRLKFNDGRQSAPFPSTIIVFNGKEYSPEALPQRLIVPSRRKRLSMPSSLVVDEAA